MLNFAKRFAGAPEGYKPYESLTPAALANVGPGNLEQFFAAQLGAQNPQFAQSAMGQRLAGLPKINAPTGANTALQGVMPKYQADQSQYLQSQIAPYLSPRPNPEGGGANMALGNQLPYAPYTPGGLATLLGPRGFALFQQGVPINSIPGMMQQQDEAARFAAGGNM
jgi:hypothetical protein